MNIISGIITVFFALGIAFLLNKTLAGRIENRRQKLVLQIVTYIVCFLLSVVFIIIGNLKTSFNNFIDEKIVYIENELNAMFPNTNILESEIDMMEIVETFDELHQITEFENTSEYGYLESIVLRIFIGKFKGYIDIAENQVNKLADAADETGIITIKSVLLHIKEQTLDIFSSYFAFARILVIVLLLVYIVVYGCVVIFLKKGGGSYNKSIVFGDGDRVSEGEKRDTDTP